jgi:uncharacterized protein (TIGR00297 family)
MASPSPLLALPIAGAIAAAAWRARALTGPGAIAATLVGTAILATTGWPGGAVLLAFFLPSSAVGHLGLALPSASDARGERRDPVQVIANGGAAAAAGFAEWLAPGLGFWMVTASLAAASADTWATSIGRLSPTAPRDLLTGIRVLRGTSGAVSLVGSLGGVAGAAVVAGVAALVGGSLTLFTVATVIGVGGMLADSLLGATLQARYVCPACGEASERQVHRCGTRTVRNGGWRWLDNDAVNALATLFAALAGGGVWLWLARS